MNIRILIILKMLFLIISTILDLMLVLESVNDFGNLCSLSNINRLYTIFLKIDLF